MALGPWAYWPLDETAGAIFHDVSGNARDASWSAGTNVLGVTGLVPTSADFATDTVSANTTAAGLPFTMTRVSFLAWINTLQAAASICIFEVNAPGAQIFAQFRIQANLLYFQMDDNVPTAYFVTGGAAINDGRNHFLAGTYDGAALRIYIDGALTATQPAVFTPWTGNRDCGLGYIPNFIGGTHFQGVLDDMTIFDRALTATEISDLWLLATTI